MWLNTTVPVSTARIRRWRSYPSLQAKSGCSNSLCIKWRRSHSAWTLNLPPDHDKEQISPFASLEARWPAEQACRNARHLRRLLELENASLWPLGPGNLVCAHGTTTLINHESSELVVERIFYALQIRTRTIWSSEKYFSLYIVS